MPPFLRKFLLGRFIARIEAGKFGERPQRIYRALKGKKLITGLLLGVVSGGFAYVCAFAAGACGVAWTSGLTDFSALLVHIGLVDKGTLSQPPQIPADLRESFELVLSFVTWTLQGITGVIWVGQYFNQPWAGSDGTLSFIALVIASVTGYFATLMRDPRATN